MAWVLGDYKLREELSANARHTVEQKFALEKVTEKHLALYREILNQK